MKDIITAEMDKNIINLECPYCNQTFKIELPFLTKIIDLALKGALEGSEYCQKILEQFIFFAGGKTPSVREGMKARK